jgi:L-ribulokinase
MLEKLREILVAWNSGRAIVVKQMMKHGSAKFGLVLSGNQVLRYDLFHKTAQIMVYQKKVTSKPIPENQKVYQKLFANYLRLHDCFGAGGNNVMKTLETIKIEVKHGS